MKELKLIAKTMHGMEKILSWELEELGAKNIQILLRAVTFEGDLELLYKANYRLRTALRIMVQTYQFPAQDPTELYDAAKEIAWEKHLGLDETFAVDCTVSSDLFPHSKYASLKLKDAIVDRFREKLGKRPNVDPKRPNLQLNLFIQKDQCYISIDSSGDSLHIRGYRNSGHLSPLNEVLGAGMVVLSGWTKDKVLWDPMCGSGTLAIEAAMIASKTPAGICREEYAFMRWKDFDPKLWEKVKKEANDLIDKEGIRIKASDISGIHVRMTRSSAEKVGLEECMEFIRGDFFESEGEEETLLMNPPYGERLEHKDIYGFYTAISDHLKMQFPGSDCWLISSNDEALKGFGLRPSKKTVLYNGSLECLFQKFELYDGSRKGEQIEKVSAYSDTFWPDPDTYKPMKPRMKKEEEEGENRGSQGRDSDRKPSGYSRDSRDRGASREGADKRSGGYSRESKDRGASREGSDRKPGGYSRDKKPDGRPSYSKDSRGPGSRDSSARRSTPSDGPKPERDRTYRPKPEGERNRTYKQQGDRRSSPGGGFKPKSKWAHDPDRAFKQRSEWNKDGEKPSRPAGDWNKDGERSSRPKGDWNKDGEKPTRPKSDWNKGAEKPTRPKSDWNKGAEKPTRPKSDWNKGAEKPTRPKSDWNKGAEKPTRPKSDWKKDDSKSFKPKSDRPYKERTEPRKESRPSNQERKESPRSNPRRDDSAAPEKKSGFKDSFLKAGKKNSKTKD